MDIIFGTLLLMFVLLPGMMRVWTSRTRSKGTSLAFLQDVWWSFSLRGILAALAWFYSFTGGMIEEKQTITPPLMMHVWVDVSQSVVNPKSGRGVNAYFESVRSRVEALRGKLERPIEVQYRLFANLFGPPHDELDQKVIDEIATLQPHSTNLSLVIEQALALPLSSNKLPLLVVFTDGWESQRGLPARPQEEERLLGLLGQVKIPMWVVPVDGKEISSPTESSIPRIVRANFPSGTFPNPNNHLELSVASVNRNKEMHGRLYLFDNDLPLLITGQWSCGDRVPNQNDVILLPFSEKVKSKKVDCPPLPIALTDAPRIHQLTVALMSPVDKIASMGLSDLPRLPTNAQWRSIHVGVPEPPSVLVLDGNNPEGACSVTQKDSSPPKKGISRLMALLQMRLDWKIHQQCLPINDANSVDFLDYELVILNDVGPNHLAADPIQQGQVLNRLANHVHHGGGLAVIGGQETYGHNGYANTPLAPLLPVIVQPKGSSWLEPMTLMILLDVSPNILEHQDVIKRLLDYVRESVDSLPQKESLVGVLGFDDRPHLLLPLTPFEGATLLSTRIEHALKPMIKDLKDRKRRNLELPGGVPMYKALKEVFALLEKQPSRDGKSDTHRILLLVDGTTDYSAGMLSWWTNRKGSARQEDVLDLFKREARKFPNMKLNIIALQEDQLYEKDWIENLKNLATVGKGTLYHDKYGIPHGDINRRMVDFIQLDQVGDSPEKTMRVDPNHAFFYGLPDPQYTLPSLRGFAPVPMKDGAESAIVVSHDFQFGNKRDFSLLTNWTAASWSRSSPIGMPAPLSIGGRVLTLTTSLNLIEMSSWENHRTLASALERALEWSQREHRRDVLKVVMHRVDQHVQIHLFLEWTDSLHIRKVSANLLPFSNQAKSAGNIQAATTTRHPFVRLDNHHWFQSIPLPDQGKHFLAQFQIEGVRDGKKVKLSNLQADLVPNLLQNLEDQPVTGQVNIPLLEKMRQQNSSVQLWKDQEPPGTATLAQSTPYVVTVRNDWRWLVSLLFIATILLELMLRNALWSKT